MDLTTKVKARNCACSYSWGHKCKSTPSCAISWSAVRFTCIMRLLSPSVLGPRQLEQGDFLFLLSISGSLNMLVTLLETSNKGMMQWYVDSSQTHILH